MNVRDPQMPPIERAVFALRELYEQYGYKKYKMSKFEEYDLYLENKSFLPSQQIISFTDQRGRLLALKPDVTLSIAKHVPVDPTEPEKVYYNENVYRTPRGSWECSEISQVGLECIGNIDLYSQCEVIALAYRSLMTLNSSFVMTLSHLGFVSGLLESCGLSHSLSGEMLALIEQKNAHEIIRVCDKSCLSDDKRDALVALTRLHGAFEEIMLQAEKLVCNDEMSFALSDLREIYSALPRELDKTSLMLDFSVINDLSYYNGLIFQGYVRGVPRAILSGGRYDKLMEKLGKNAQAIGFAVYVDELQHLLTDDEGIDVDVLLIYDKDLETAGIVEAVESLRAQGKTVRAQSGSAEKLRFSQLLRLTERGLVEVE